ncbi:MAG: hypothetical protein ACI9G6_001744, partial [Limisphaerales bacterium]
SDLRPGAFVPTFSKKPLHSLGYGNDCLCA